ncbi:hypothetical protein [Aerococcus viridans]|uniref:hypothetical protein n=1 Tax=Aerococcus viridans TaxID=1377 RepID=UPI003B2161F6
MSVNAVIATVTGSTKREASNRAKTTYIVTSYSGPMTNVDIRTTATSGTVVRTGLGNSKPNSSKATVTTFINYSGGSRYFKFKGYTQIYTPKGASTKTHVFNIESIGIYTAMIFVLDVMYLDLMSKNYEENLTSSIEVYKDH